MTAHVRRSAGRWLLARAGTLALYVFAIVGATSWDDDPNSWFRIALRLTSAATFLWWAVDRTAGHREEDRGAHDDH